MSYKDTIEQLAAYRRQIATIRDEMRALQAGVEPEPVEDYQLVTSQGPIRLSALFGDKNTLFVIHNMGAGCSYCTLWADGFNGVLPHLESRAAFVVSSPDAPERQESSRPLAAGASGWCLTGVRPSRRTWATRARTAGCLAFRCSEGKTARWSGSPIPAVPRVTISARCGICSI